MIIPRQTLHHFSAEKTSRFLVADMSSLLENARHLGDPCAEISIDLVAFCSYAGMHLTNASESGAEILLFSLFWRLLEQQDFTRRIDHRISRAVQLIEDDLSIFHPASDLARAACLSVSQFKLLFKREMGVPCLAYVSNRRMERARAQLINTDYPIGVVAGDVGYEDASAFTRRFKKHFGQSPRTLARR